MLANSMALLADAGHNFGDVFGLLLAWGAHSMARWLPTKRYTYGFRSALSYGRFSVLNNAKPPKPEPQKTTPRAGNSAAAVLHCPKKLSFCG